MNATATVQRMTGQDAQILAEYADPKMTMRAIATKLDVALDEVNQVCVDLARADRQAAHTLVDAWRRTPKGKRWLAAQEKAAPKEAEPAPGYVSGPDCAPADEVPRAADLAFDEPTGRPTPHLDAVKAELDEERERHQATADELVKVVNELAAVDQAAGRDIGKENEPLLDRIADLKRGREEATERVIELVKRVAELEAQLEQAEQRMVVDEANTLVTAEHSGDATLKAAAFNVRTELRQLADRVEQWQRETPLREELAQIEARAAEIRAQLGAAS